MSDHQGTPNDPLPGGMRRALAAGQAQVAALDSALHSLAEPSARQLILTVDRWCDIASNPRNPTHLQALRLLRELVRVLDRAREVAGPLAVVHHQAPPPNGTT